MEYEIIIKNEIIDPLQIDSKLPSGSNFPEIMEKYAKKKKKHSKHSEQRKSKPKHVSKGKRKRDNVSLFDTSTSNISDANMQHKISPDLNIYPVNISNNQRKISLIDLKVSISNELNKRITNNTDQMKNLASNDDKKDMEKLTISAVKNRPNIYLSTNRSDSSKITNMKFENCYKFYICIRLFFPLLHFDLKSRTDKIYFIF